LPNVHIRRARPLSETDLVASNFRVQTLMTPDRRHLRAAVWEPSPDQPPRAICILLQGFAEFIEKYGEVADELTARGFIVATMDWRSQGASERRMVGNRAGHVRSFDEYDSDFAALLVQMVEPIQRSIAASGRGPLPVIVLAHSMGAHILLRFLHDHPRRFAGGVLIAPLLGVDTGKYSPGFTKTLTFILNAPRASSRFVFGVEEHDPLETTFETNTVTSDRARFERNLGALKAQPCLRIYGPTFGWLGAVFQSLARFKRRGFAEDISTPLLIFGAGRDRVIPTAPIRDFVTRLPNAKYVEFETAEHEILMESDSIRKRFWSEFDAFVSARLSEPAPILTVPRSAPH
jgi:lysophospholipase